MNVIAPINKRRYTARRTKEEIRRSKQLRRFRELQKELREERSHDWPGRIKTNDMIRKEQEFQNLKHELS